LWLAPRVAALDELNAFSMRFAQALFGNSVAGMNPQQLSTLSALLPGIGTAMVRVSEETSKLDGTPLATTLLIESVKSAAEMKAAPAQPSAGAGGLGGMLGARIMRGRGQVQARSTIMTSTTETLSIASAATDADVAVPAGFQLRK
jgi:hypothetical protein